MSNYSKNLAGVKQKVFVSPATAYSDSTTLAGFLTEAADGEIGVFLSDGSLVTGALSAGDVFLVAQMRDGFINKTPLIKWDELFDSRLTAYSAPVRQVSAIGYNASATGEDVSFDFTDASNTNTLTYGIAVRETTPGNQPFPIQEGYVQVNSSTQDEYDALATIVSALNQDVDYERTQPDRFVKAEIQGSGALTELTEDATVTNGSKIVTFAGVQTIAAGVKLSFRGAIYKVAVGVTAGTSLTLDRPYQGATETIDVSATTDLAASMAYTSGTTKLGVKLTGLNDFCHFKVAGTGDFTGDTVTAITDWALGAGSGASIVEVEKEGRFMDGVGSVINAAFAADYGLPTLYADATDTYEQIFLDFAPAITPGAGLPIYKTQQIMRLHIISPSGGTSPDDELQTVFGL